MSGPAEARLVGGRYLLGDLIGQGGAGEVFTATDQRLERRVAIKLMSSRVEQRKDAEKRFLREAKIGAQLSHKHLIQTYDFGQDGQRYFLAMEYLEGRDMADVLHERGTLNQAEVLRIGEQVSAGLALAHDKGLVHRDLKPENIFLVSESPMVCKVIDFGMAIVSPKSAAGDARLTVDGSICGTPRYMSPEQLRGEDPVGESDVYALGCVLYELLTGAPPYDHDALGEVAARHLFAPIPQVEAGTNHVAPVLAELIRRCMSKVAAARPSMEQVHQRIATVRSADVKSGSVRTPAPIRRDQRSSFDHADTPTEQVTRDDVEEKLASNKGSAGKVALLGVVPDEVEMSLRAAGYNLVETEDLPASGALICLNVSDEVLASACQVHPLVLADAEAGNMENISQLLRYGVSEVITRPVSPDKLISKLRRAIRMHARNLASESQ